MQSPSGEPESRDRVLVTGAGGLLGEALVATLRARGDLVRALSRRPLPATSADEVIVGDFTDAATARRAVQGVTAVYHAAAVTRKWLPDGREFDRVNVDAAVQLARFAAEAAAQRVVHVSSFTVFGPATTPAPRGEVALADESALQNDYQRSKRRAHARLAELAARDGLPVVLACPGVLFGVAQAHHLNPVVELMQKLLAGRLRAFPGLDRVWSLAWLPDVADGLRRLRHRARIGSTHVLGGENTTLRRLLDGVAAAAGRTPPRGAPLWPFLAAGRVLEWLGTATRRAPRVTAASLRFLRAHWAFSSQRAIADLGYRITPLAAALHAVWKDLHDRQIVANAPPAAVPAA